jgi:hypothetical protein
VGLDGCGCGRFVSKGSLADEVGAGQICKYAGRRWEVGGVAVAVSNCGCDLSGGSYREVVFGRVRRSAGKKDGGAF